MRAVLAKHAVLIDDVRPGTELPESDELLIHHVDRVIRKHSLPTDPAPPRMAPEEAATVGKRMSLLKTTVEAYAEHLDDTPINVLIDRVERATRGED